jgi:hypothetical protein
VSEATISDMDNSFDAKGKLSHRGIVPSSKGLGAETSELGCGNDSVCLAARLSTKAPRESSWSSSSCSDSSSESSSSNSSEASDSSSLSSSESSVAFLTSELQLRE